MKFRIPLAGQPNQRYLDSLQALIEGKDQRYINGLIIPIPNPLTGKVAFYFEKRPGLEASPIADCLGEVAEGSAGTTIFFSRATGRTISVFSEHDVFVNCDSAGEIKVDPEEQIPGYGLYGGGGPSASDAERSTYKYVWQTDAISSGTDLTMDRANLAAAGNDDLGLFGGGRLSSTPFNDTSKYTYSGDTTTDGTDLVRAQHVSELAAAGNATVAIFAGGEGGGFVFGVSDKYTYSGDTCIAGTTLTNGLTRLRAVGNSTFGLFAGGSLSGGSQATTIKNKYTYGTDTAALSTILLEGRRSHAAMGNGSYGLFICGQDASLVRRVTTEKHIYSNDTVATGTSLAAISDHCAAANPTFGVSLGGSTTGNNSVLDTYKYNFGTDAVVNGTSMTAALWVAAATSSNPGHL